METYKERDISRETERRRERNAQREREREREREAYDGVAACCCWLGAVRGQDRLCGVPEWSREAYTV